MNKRDRRSICAYSGTLTNMMKCPCYMRKLFCLFWGVVGGGDWFVGFSCVRGVCPILFLSKLSPPVLHVSLSHVVEGVKQ